MKKFAETARLNLKLLSHSFTLDATFFFSKEETATEFLNDLRGRVEKFGLNLNSDKTRSLKIAKGSHAQFNFLGFTFYWGKQGTRCTLKIKTQKEKLIKAIQEFYHWIKKIRSREKLKDIWALAKSKIRGHINYYGYGMNGLKLNHFYWSAVRSLFKWLNRRSQKRSYSWEGFKERHKYFPLMTSLDKMKLKQLGSPYAN